MGQYHVLVNLDKKECVWPHPLGAGLKLWEQIANHPSTPEALVILLACSNGRGGGDLCVNDSNGIVGRWAGDRIAIVGDYADPGDLLPDDEADTIYERCHDSYNGPDKYTDITLLVKPVIERELRGQYKGDGWARWISDEEENHG